MDSYYNIKKIFIVIMILSVFMGLSSCSNNDEGEQPVPIPEQTKFSSALINVSLNDSTMPDIQNRTRSAEGLRTVVEAYNMANHYSLLRHQTTALTTASSGQYTLEVDSLPVGKSDIYVWIDNGYYNTSDLKAVSFGENYTTDSNKRKAFYGRTSVDISEDATTQGTIDARSPFARYRIEALDVEEYEKRRTANGWPPLEDVQIKITYEGYFPSSFNVISGKPNNASQNVSYDDKISISSDGRCILASDYVLVNGAESTIRIRIDIMNIQTDEVISSIPDVDVTYKRGYETVVSGNILTAGNMSGDVNIDTRWEGDYDVSF